MNGFKIIMTYQINYLIGKTKNNNTDHWAEIEAEDAFYALKNFREQNPEAKVFICIEKGE